MTLTIDTSARGEAVVLSLAGEIDVHTVPRLRACLDELGDGRRQRVVVDLTGIEFLDSSALGALLGGQRKVEDAGGSMSVVCAQPRILKVFQITRLTEVIPVFTSVDEACG